MKRDSITIAGIDLELTIGGAGPPLLLLHGDQGIGPNQPFLNLLKLRHRVVAPSHPGFGRSALPDWLDSVDDIAHVYLELLDRLGLRSADLVGCSIGGWIAAEMVTKAPERVNRLVLSGPMGIKVGPRDRLDIPDIFALPADQVRRLLWHDPALGAVDPASLADDELRIVIRNRETLAMLCWEPFMHNPKLPRRLHRAALPALLLRGESDGMISPSYLDAYAALLPRATVRAIAAAGHLPEIEQPEAFAAAVIGFLAGDAS